MIKMVHIFLIKSKMVLQAVAYGETRPLEPNESPAQRRKNRRVQIILR
jgi:flagellar motor protein MotB